MNRLKGRSPCHASLFVLVLGFLSAAGVLPTLGWSWGTTNHVYTPGGTFFSSAAIGTNGTIYVGSKSSSAPNLYALRPNGTTQHVWTLAGRTYAPPSIGPDGTIYIGCESNTLHALNPDGTTQRHWTTSCRITCHAAIARDGTLYVTGYYDSRLYSFNPDGTTNGIWDVSASGYIVASPVLNSNDQVLVLGSSGDLLLINSDGSTQTTWQVGTSSYSTPAIGPDGTIYVGGLNSTLYAFNPDGTTQRVWTTTKSIDYSCAAVGTNGVVYVGDTGGNLYGFDVGGTTQHVWKADGAIYSSPTLGADGTIYVGCNTGTNFPGAKPNFFAFNADGTTATVWQLHLGAVSSARVQASAAIGLDGTVYIGSYDEEAFFALPGTGGKLMNSPWPKYGQNQFNTARPPFCDATPDNGPSTGGIFVVFSSYLLGSGSDITNVTFDGVSAGSISAQGIGWVRARAPAGLTGRVDVAIYSTSVGVSTFPESYLYNGPGMIGIDVMDEWVEVAGMPAARKYVGGDTLGSYFYAAGGRDLADGDTTNVYRFDGSSWTEVTGLPDIRSRMGVAAYNDRLYAVGGYRTSVPVTNVFVFDGTNWAQTAGLPAARHSPAVGVMDGYLYAVGGESAADAETNVYRFDGASWTEVAGLPARRYAAAAAVLEDNLYVIGGFNASDVAQTNVYRFDGASWSEVLGLPESQAYAGAAVLSGTLNVIGGTSSSNVYRYGVTNWEAGAVMPAHRSAFAGGVLDGYYYAAGGAGPAGNARANTYRYLGRAFESGVEPASGPTAGGFAVAIWGTNLCNGSLSDVADVRLCSIPATIDSVSATQILVTAGAAPGPSFGDVKVVSTAFGTTWGSNRFTYADTDMLILGTNGLAIPNDAVPNVARGTDFGMLRNTSSVTHTLTITNNGTGALLISGWVTNQPLPIFTVTGIPASVPAGGTAAFTVGYTPVFPGSYAAELIISNNASGAESNFVVNLRGSAYALSSYRGPGGGGNPVTITNGLLGNGFDILSVKVNGASALILTQGVNWARVLMPANNAGPATIVTRSVSKGSVVFPDVYFYDPYIRAIASPHGNIIPSGVVNLDYGASTSFVVLAGAYYHIGTVQTNGTADPAAAGLMRYTSVWNNVTASGLVVAIFDANVTANTGTPEWWLALHGLTNGGASFSEAATNDADGDLVPTSDEYLSDTIPTNGDSYLRFTDIQQGIVTWRGGTGVVQFLEMNLPAASDEWSLLATDPPPTPGTNAAAVDVEADEALYRVRAKR